MFSGSSGSRATTSGSDRRLPGLEDPDRRRDDLRRETREDLADRASEDLGLGLIAEHAEHAIRPDDAQIAVDDRDAHRGLADEGVEQRLGLERCARPRHRCGGSVGGSGAGVTTSLIDLSCQRVNAAR